MEWQGPGSLSRQPPHLKVCDRSELGLAHGEWTQGPDSVIRGCMLSWRLCQMLAPLTLFVAGLRSRPRTGLSRKSLGLCRRVSSPWVDPGFSHHTASSLSPIPLSVPKYGTGCRCLFVMHPSGRTGCLRVSVRQGILVGNSFTSHHRPQRAGRKPFCPVSPGPCSAVQLPSSRCLLSLASLRRGAPVDIRHPHLPVYTQAGFISA